MRLFQAALDTPLDSPFSATLSVHGLHFTVCAPSINASKTNDWTRPQLTRHCRENQREKPMRNFSVDPALSYTDIDCGHRFLGPRFRLLHKLTCWTFRIFFIFVCSEEGKGESEAPGGGDFLLKIPGGGGLPDVGNWGGGLNIFIRGRNSHIN